MCKFLFPILSLSLSIYIYIDMTDIMSRHHGRDGGDELPRHPFTVPGDCEFAPPPN